METIGDAQSGTVAKVLRRRGHRHLVACDRNPEKSATVGVLVQSMTGCGRHVRETIDCEQVQAMMQNH